MIISHKHRFIFVKTGKTAGTSIECFFSSICGQQDIFTPFIYPEEGHRPRNWRQLYSPLPDINYCLRTGLMRAYWKRIGYEFLQRKKYTMHSPAWQIRLRVKPEIWDGYFKWSIDRNPFDKVLSGWHYWQWRYKREIPLDDYLEKLKAAIAVRKRGVGSLPWNYLNYTDPETGKLMVDQVIRFENLHEGLSEVCDNLGISFSPAMLPHAKGTIRKDKTSYSKTLTEEQCDKIRVLFKDELEMHGYTFQGSYK
jgi:hypothetical protein